MSQRIAVIHIAKSLKKAYPQAKTCQRVCLPNRTMKMKLVANLKEKYIKMTESQPLTKAIRNLGNMLIFKLIALNRISAKLKSNRFKIPNYA